MATHAAQAHGQRYAVAVDRERPGTGYVGASLAEAIERARELSLRMAAATRWGGADVRVYKAEEDGQPGVPFGLLVATFRNGELVPAV
jgi:hypothetical protein